MNKFLNLLKLSWTPILYILPTICLGLGWRLCLSPNLLSISSLLVLLIFTYAAPTVIKTLQRRTSSPAANNHSFVNNFSPAQTLRFYRLQFIRILLTVPLSIGLLELVDFGVAGPWFVVATMVGVGLAGLLLRRGLSFLQVGFALLGCELVVLIICRLIDSYNVSSLGLKTSVVRDQLLVLYLCVSVSLSSTWLFWTKRWGLTLETFAATASAVFLLSGHRNYQLDTPQSLSELAWIWGVAPELLLLMLGVATTLLATLYLGLGFSRPLFRYHSPLPTRGRLATVRTVLAVGIILLAFGFIVRIISSSYSNDLTRASNGVGQETKTGESPLGFHSATGQTKQPAALVRFEGDYSNNPWSPMLYIREGALSEFNGHELVIADSRYDTDLPRSAVGVDFTKEQHEADEFREQVVQSIYLLTEHTAPFAIDYPISLRPIKNPDPQRFRLSYQAVSLAPTIRAAELIGEESGEANWSKEEWEHYLRAPGSLSSKSKDSSVDATTKVANTLNEDHPTLDANGEDLRYLALSRKLIPEGISPADKAKTLTEYLSAESIYTRNPGHKTGERDDPVAPYLFAKEKRGYCVHFAHAAVYLLRLAGVPARIATGYLTDTSYAKDGHILLQIGDRHAWPEVYIRGRGWVVFDVTPARAENEQVLVPDEKLLEELMGKLDPAEELITPPAGTSAKQEISRWWLKTLNRQVLIIIAALTLLMFFLTKMFLRWGYLITSSPEKQARRRFRALATDLIDRGYEREEGETRREFVKRLAHAGVLTDEALTLVENIELAGGLKSKMPFKKNLPPPYHPRSLWSYVNPRSISLWGRW